MKKRKALIALSVVVAMLASPSLFADKRHEKKTKYGRSARHDVRRVTVEGRIRDIDRDRNGFVIRLDNNNYYLFAPVQTRVHAASSYGRNGRTRVRNLERGDYIRATGSTSSRGYVTVNNITLLRSEDRYRDRNDVWLSGLVQRVDQRGDVIWVEDARSRRVVAVDVRRVDRSRNRYDVDDIRRGDRVTVRGDWTRDGRFHAETLEVDRGAWW